MDAALVSISSSISNASSKDGQQGPVDREATDHEHQGYIRATALLVEGDLFMAGRSWYFLEIKRSHCRIATFQENKLCEDWHDSRAELTLLSYPEPERPREEREAAVDLSMPPLRNVCYLAGCLSWSLGRRLTDPRFVFYGTGRNFPWGRCTSASPEGDYTS